jgi:hypothetical protein
VPSDEFVRLLDGPVGVDRAVGGHYTSFSVRGKRAVNSASIQCSQEAMVGANSHLVKSGSVLAFRVVVACQQMPASRGTGHSVPAGTSSWRCPARQAPFRRPSAADLCVRLRERTIAHQADPRSPFNVIVTSRRTAALEGRRAAAPRAWMQ